VDLKEQLGEILEIKGVTSALVVGQDGFVIDGVSKTDMDLDFLGGIAASGLASSKALADFLAKGEVTQTMVEYQEGPVILSPMGEGANEVVFVATLDSTANLGRVRFQLKKSLPKLLEAIAR